MKINTEKKNISIYVYFTQSSLKLLTRGKQIIQSGRKEKKTKAIGRILNNKSQLDKKISSNAFIIRITVNKLQFSMKTQYLQLN